MHTIQTATAKLPRFVGCNNAVMNQELPDLFADDTAKCTRTTAAVNHVDRQECGHKNSDSHVPTRAATAESFPAEPPSTDGHGDKALTSSLATPIVKPSSLVWDYWFERKLSSSMVVELKWIFLIVPKCSDNTCNFNPVLQARSYWKVALPLKYKTIVPIIGLPPWVSERIVVRFHVVSRFKYGLNK